MSEEIDRKVEAPKDSVERKHEWLAPDASAERTRFYSEMLHQSSRAELAGEIVSGINSDAREIVVGDTLGKYLLSVLKTKDLMKKALASLQLLGYQVDFFPKGYQVEVKEGKLSIFRMKDGEREFYKSPSGSIEVNSLELLSARIVQRRHLFESGSSYVPVNRKVASSITQGREMIKGSLDNGNFSKITGSVNGVKISSRVKISGRHVLAAKELLYLFDNQKAVFGNSAISWMAKDGMMDYLRALSGKDWGFIKKMNTPGRKEFKAARSVDGVIQLTLAWRRARTVLPKDVVSKIRDGSLSGEALTALEIDLIQTENTVGRQANEDRKVQVETILNKDLPSPVLHRPASTMLVGLEGIGLAELLGVCLLLQGQKLRRWGL